MLRHYTNDITLVKTLNDYDALVEAAGALGKMGDKRAVRLIDALERELVPYRVKEYLVMIGEPAIEPLINVLMNEKHHSCVVAAEVLGEIGDARAVKPLIQALKNEERRLLRENAAEALIRIGKPAVEPLIQALKDEYYKDEYYHARGDAAEALGKIGDERAIEPLIQALKDEDYHVQGNAAFALIRIGKPAVEPLIQALKDEDINVRSEAAETLGEIGDARAVEPLIQALKDKEGLVRSSVAKALREIGDARAVEPLIQALKDAEVRKVAEEEYNLSFVPTGYLDKDGEVREVAEEALKRIQTNKEKLNCDK